MFLIRAHGVFLTLVSVIGIAPALTAQSVAAKSLRSPEVTHTGQGPTGYTVTFRFANPTAKQVSLKGEWSFARPGEMSQITPTPGYPVFEGQGIPPADWKPGDFPFPKFDPAHPYSWDAGWPIVAMTKGKDGTWTYSTPLPSGVFTYSFVTDCTPGAADDPKTPACDPKNGPGTTTISDPNNRPWNESKDGHLTGSIQRNSQVYVPSDPNFDTVNYSWEGPAKHKGKLTHITYPSPKHVGPQDTNYLVLYTPPNYDSARAKPYPTLYLSHGFGSGYEMNWSTEAAAGDILDNLINTGQIPPLVAVMGPKEDGFGDDTQPGRGGLAYFGRRERDVIDNVIPYVEQHYHVSTSPGDRAYSGGGGATLAFVLNHPEVFQYYGIMAAGFSQGTDALTPAQVAALKGKSVMIGGGWQDPTFVGTGPAHTGVDMEVTAFAKAGVPVMTDFINGGHTYYVFRILLQDFLTRVAFLPQPYKP